MPTLDKATVYLISQYEARVLPEYAPGKPTDPFQEDIKLYDATTRTVSVYVPVYRCSQFWIAYHAFPQDSETRFFYYKLFINGRPIVSWGCGKDDAWGGKTMFALYRGWIRGGSNNKDAIPVTEARTFHWGKSRGKSESEAEPKSDVIEVRLYRAKARKRVDEELKPLKETKAVELDFHAKSRDESASVGLFSAGPLMYGQPKRFYKYALLDPVDEPYVTFRYLYRTLPQLERLGVIALDELEKRRAEEEAVNGGEDSPAKSKGPRIIPSVSLRSIVSVRSDADTLLSAGYPQYDPQASPSPLRIPSMLSVGRRMSDLNVSADDLSQQTRDSLSSEEDEEPENSGGKDKGKGKATISAPSQSSSSFYLNQNSPLHLRTATKVKVPPGKESLPQLSTIPVLRPRSSKEQIFRDCVSSLLSQPQPLRPANPAPLDTSPTPPPRRNRLFSRTSSESLHSSSSAANVPRSSSSMSNNSASSAQAFVGRDWINDIFSRAKGRAEDRAKRELEMAVPVKVDVDADVDAKGDAKGPAGEGNESSAVREGHRESMSALVGVVNSARARSRGRSLSATSKGDEEER